MPTQTQAAAATHKRYKREVPVGRAIRSLISTETQAKGVVMAQVLTMWSSICPLLAAYSCPLKVQRQTLQVAVASDAVKQELLYLAPQLIDTINTMLGYAGVCKVTAITRGLPQPKQLTRYPVVNATPASLAKAEAKCQGVTDTALRAALTKLGAVTLTKE